MKVLVVMSTYNGAKTIQKQIDSIYNQKGVSLGLFVRDDGSTDETLKILYRNAEIYPNLSIVRGKNVGWEKSFMLALKKAPEADYYAFSDQDDIWMENKLKSGIDALKSHNGNNPLLFHCNKFSVREDLKPLSHQVRRTAEPLNHQNAMIQEFAQGCSVIMNNKARVLVTSYLPKKKIAHDFWCGLLCYLFGEVIYDDKKYFYHISYGSNASGEGHMLKSWICRFKKLLKEKEAYYSPCQDLLNGFSDKLSTEDECFCRRVLNYKYNLIDKLYLLFSLKFVRDSLLGTLSLKVAILFNKL